MFTDMSGCVVCICSFYLPCTLPTAGIEPTWRADFTPPWTLHAAARNVTFRKINLLQSRKQCQKNTEDTKWNRVLMADSAGMTELCWSHRNSSKRPGYTNIFSDTFSCTSNLRLDYFSKIWFQLPQHKRAITIELGGFCNISNYRSSRWRCCGFGQLCFNWILKTIQCWNARQTSVVKKHGQ